jgi:hypothetical protein
VDSGSIDKLDAILANAVDIDATCWWRDDLDRRVEVTDALKWSYLEIINGSDVFRLLILDKQERRADAVRAYISEQYLEDGDVKFKQIELENKLIGLFVDVPAQPSNSRNQSHLLTWGKCVLAA